MLQKNTILLCYCYCVSLKMFLKHSQCFLYIDNDEGMLLVVLLLPQTYVP